MGTIIHRPQDKGATPGDATARRAACAGLRRDAPRGASWRPSLGRRGGSDPAGSSDPLATW
jgi:hypothetical protein